MAEELTEYTDEQLENMSDEEFDKYYESMMNNTQTDNVSEESNTEETGTTQQEENPEPEVEENSQEQNIQEDSEQPVEESEKSEDKTEADELLKVYKFKADGQEYQATVKDLIEKYAPQAVNYTKKTQKIAEYMPYVEAMKAKGVTPQNVNLLIDLVSGDETRTKGLIKNLIKQYNIDPMDLELEDEADNSQSGWTPVDYGTDFKNIQNKRDFEATISELKKDPEVFVQTNAVVENLDDESKSFLYTTPGALAGLQKDIKDGIYAEVMPMANQLALNDNFSKPVMQYYLLAANQLGQAKMQEQYIKNMQLMSQKQNDVVKKQKSGLPNSAVSNTKLTSNSAEEEIWNMSDADFENFKLNK